MRLRIVLAVSATALGLAGLLATGCGIITAPLSVPAAVASNMNFNLRGPVVDHHGNPLTEVTLNQVLHHRFWEPMKGYAMTDESKILQVNQVVKINERGSSLNLAFSLPGYQTATYSMRANNDDLITTPHGDWKNAPDFPFVLYPDKPDARLAFWKGKIDCTTYPQATAIVLETLAYGAPTLLKWSADDPVIESPSIFYLTLVQQTPKPINNKGELDPRDVNLPAELTLHISGAGNGFVPMVVKPGFAPLQVSDAAPTAGYTPTLTITGTRLKEMRSTGFNLVTGHSEYFFFRVNNHFGKGYISWSRRIDPKYPEIAPAEFSLGLWLNPLPNNPNLTSFKASLRG